MKVKAVSKYNRISARKTRLVADMVRGQKASAAFDVLKFIPKKGARLIEKTLKSAIANAENNFGMDRKDLTISELLVDEGPTLKRHRPRARGMASAIRKRTAHVTIIVEGEKVRSKKESVKSLESKDSLKNTSQEKSGETAKDAASHAVYPEKK